MALKGAVRWKPDTYESSILTKISSFDPTTTPPTGDVVMIAQLVMYNDVIVTPENYKKGDPATESNITVLYEAPITKSLSSFSGMTAGQMATEWANTLSTFRLFVQPAATYLANVLWTARNAPPILLP